MNEERNENFDWYGESLPVQNGPEDIGQQYYMSGNPGTVQHPEAVIGNYPGQSCGYSPTGGQSGTYSQQSGGTYYGQQYYPPYAYQPPKKKKKKWLSVTLWSLLGVILVGSSIAAIFIPGRNNIDLSDVFPNISFSASIGRDSGTKSDDRADNNSDNKSSDGSGKSEDKSGGYYGSIIPKPGIDGNGGNGSDYDSQSPDGDMFNFFDNYYTYYEQDTLEGSKLDKIDGDKRVKIELNSNEGLRKQSFSELYENNIDSVVGIFAYPDNSSTSYYWGTGIIISSNGYIITNEHVIDSCSSAEVRLSNGEIYPALLVGEDTKADVAVLKIEANGLKAAQFGDSEELKVGQEMCVIGNPLGEELYGTLTNGIISSVNRRISVNGNTVSLIQGTAAINEGNSGGPMFDMYGRVIGMSVMRFSDSGEKLSIDGIGFFIPSKTLAFVANSLIENGIVVGRPALGITVGAIPANAKEQFSLPDGLYVSDISEGSDAAAKGVTKGDVITHVNGSPVRTTEDVLSIRDTLYVGDTMTLTIYRDGKTFDIDIVLYDQNDIYK